VDRVLLALLIVRLILALSKYAFFDYKPWTCPVFVERLGVGSV